MADLPGFRFNMRQMRGTRTSPFAIEERYAQHYHLFSGKSGGRVMPDGSLVFAGRKEIAADQARDLATALCNYEQATLALKQHHDLFGVTAVEERVNDACEALEEAWLALLSYVPRNAIGLREKAGAILSVAEADPPQLDEDHILVLLRPLMAKVDS